MPNVERYFELNPAQRALRHHALVDAMALRWAWIVENYSFDGDVGSAASCDPHYGEWLLTKVKAARSDPRTSIPHEIVMEKLTKHLEAIKARLNDD
jgi:hypothetical protein